MKYAITLATLLVTLGLAIPAFAAANKVCYGAREAKGSNFLVYVTLNNLKITDAAGAEAQGLDGIYSYTSDINGQDGKDYLEFEGARTGQSLVVSRDLHAVDSTGVIKVRDRSRSFSETTFFCRDQQ